MALDLSKPNSGEHDDENEHLLQHKWVLWFRPPASHSSSAPQAKAWESSQKEHFTAKTVEDFWRGFKRIPRITPSHPINCDYSLFKEGIKPMWEDDFNKAGGRWTYTVERRSSTPSTQTLPAVIEQLWLDVMLSLIGENFDPYGDEIAGGVCGIRKPMQKAGEPISAKIHLWTKDASKTEVNMKIGEILKEVLHAHDGQLAFAPHDSNGNKRGGHGNLRL